MPVRAPAVRVPVQNRRHLPFKAGSGATLDTDTPVLHSGVLQVAGDFFQFDLYEGCGRDDLLLPATDKHLIKRSLDSSLRCELSCGTPKDVGPMTTGDVALVRAGLEARWRRSRVNLASIDVRSSKAWLARQVYGETDVARAQDEFVPAACLVDPFILRIGLALRVKMRELLAASQMFAAEGAVLLLRRHLLRRVSRHQPGTAEPGRDRLGGWRLRRVKAATEVAETTLTLETLAARVGLGATHFCTGSRQSTGLPPHRWQIGLRTQRSKVLFNDPRLSLTEVTLACGYASSSHFANSFGRATSVTPSTYWCGSQKGRRCEMSGRNECGGLASSETCRRSERHARVWEGAFVTSARLWRTLPARS